MLLEKLIGSYLKPKLGTYHSLLIMILDSSNWGTESDDSSYHNGNSDPRGFGHIGILVPDVEAACAKYVLHLIFNTWS